MLRIRRRATLLVGALVLVFGTSVAAAHEAVSQPHALAPRPGSSAQLLPFFGWSGAAGAERYEFSIAADPGFNSPVLGSGGTFATQNTRATLLKTLPNGSYWWRVRAVTKAGAVGSWSTAARFAKVWRTAPRLTAPGNRRRVSYPMPLVLAWQAVPGAATYDVSISSDPGLGSLISSQPIETSALSLAPAVALHAGAYYWAVTPIDAEGNKGVRSQIHSFQWAWPSVPTNLSVQDLVGAEMVDPATFGSSSEKSLYLPQFRWSAVPGATRYEVEINSDQTWATGSRVCCDDKILAPVFTPPESLKSNRYYWRVRAFDADGNPGKWTPQGNGTDDDSFIKTFDNVCNSELPANCIPAGGQSIQNLRVEDWSGARVTGGSTSSPVVMWDPVPGASSYDYDITPFIRGSCDFTWPLSKDHWRGTTAVAAWTPLGVGPTSTKPYPDDTPVSSDNERLVAGTHYCVRIRAQTDRDSHGDPVYGDYATIADAFTYAGPQSGVISAVGGGDYLTPSAGQQLHQMPVLRWRPVAGAASYWVLVARDPSFTNIVDYAFTQEPAYAPRTNSSTTTYADETTTYYWVVLPSPNSNGTAASGDPVGGPHGTFQKQIPPASLPVTLEQPQPVFRWRPVAGARHYELEVSADPNFGTSLEKVKTVSTSYTAAVTYPAGKRLYWRVRADDEENVGLSWATNSFAYRLGAPSLRGNLKRSDMIPTWRWKPVPGATSYDLHVDLPNGTRRDFTNIRTAAFTATKMTGTGIFHWQVRANFPSAYGATHGPYSPPLAFARTITPPSGARTIGGGNAVVLTWRPKVGAKQYKVQVSSRPDFSLVAEQQTTDNVALAPSLASYAYGKGGRFYWRVAVVDADNNSGDYTAPRTFKLPPRKS